MESPEHSQPEVSTTSTEQSELSIADKEFIERIKLALGQEFDSQDREQLAGILSGRLLQYAELLDRPLDEVRDLLLEATHLPTREEFITAAYPIFEPLVRAKRENPEGWQKIAQQAFIRQGQFETVNQLLAYEIDGHTLHLHIPPNEATSIKDKLQLLYDGLAGIAQIVNEHPEIEYIAGKSWIVAKHPALMEKLGFSVEEVSEDDKRQNFGSDPRGVKLATMSRQDFLSRYL